MAIYLENMKYMKLYKKQMFLPIIKKNKRKGSAILLLTKDFHWSKQLMNYSFFINRSNLFESYYVEKDIMYTVNNEHSLQIDHIDNATIINEQASVYTEVTDVKNYDNQLDCSINELYCQLGNHVIFFNEMYDEEFLQEVKTYNTRYKKLLYYDRFRNNKEVFNIYANIKNIIPWIKYTYIDYKRYKEKNMYIDLSYYNNAFLGNNTFTVNRSIDMYYEFLRRSITDRRINKAGYTRKTVFIPVFKAAWNVEDGNDIWDFKKELNPISVIYKKLKLSPNELKDKFSGIDFIFMGKKGYFKMNMDEAADNAQTMKNRFLRNIRILITGETITDDNDEPDTSSDVIADNIIERIEKNKGIKIHNLTGDAGDTDDVKEKMKADLVKKIDNAAENTTSEDEALEKMDNDEALKQLIDDLQAEADDGIKLSAARVNRINKTNDELMKKKLKNKTIKQMIEEDNKVEELPETELPIDTINDEWKHLKAINFEKEYDVDADIVAMLYSLSNIEKSYPVSILDIDMQDTSTTEDSIYTYRVKCEGYNGKRWTLVFDIPKFREGRFLRLRGNEKIYSIEMPLIPISKTDPDTVQIATNYKKIFVRTYYTSSGKSNVFTDRLMKALDKYDGKDIKIYTGDNSRICAKYELPTDYIDLANKYSKIEYNNYIFYFNQDELRSNIKVDETKGLPIGIKDGKEVIYYNANMTLSEFICYDSLFNSEGFREVYNLTKSGKKYTYSRATVMAADIPIIVVLSHAVGLIRAMDAAGIQYNIVDKRPKLTDIQDMIKFEDAYIVYSIDYNSSMLMNGLKDCNTEIYSIKQVNSKSMWVEMLDNFGGRLKSDGLDNFKDLCFDPITVEVCHDYQLPDNYVDALIYANNLLADNKYVKQIDLANNRYRTAEVVAVHFYQVLSKSYGDYATIQRRGGDQNMFIKQDAVINSVLSANTTSDLSVFQPLSELESRNAISFKGVNGMNAERAYNIDKRGYDESMLNILAQATGFANTVGMNRQTSINPNIVGGRGYFKQSNIDEINNVNTFSVTESLSPYTVRSDDPFRNAMTFVQTSKHNTPIEKGAPLLVTTGADAAMPYLTSDMFCHKAKKKGKVKEIVEGKYLLVEYDDKTTEYVTLEERTMKNSDGGFYISLELVTDLKVGQTVKENTILAYDKKSFSSKVGDHKQLAYNLGCVAKIAIMTTEDGYEDSAIGSEWLSEAMSSDIVVMKAINLPAQTDVLQIPKKGDHITEGDPIFIFQNPYDEEDANALLKLLGDDEDAVSEIGRNSIHAKVTGVIQDVKIYRTVELDELSDSLRKIVSKREAEIKKYSSIANKAENDTVSIFDPVGKLEATGKLKGVDGVRIEIFMKYHDQLSVGDKVVANSANKMVLMNVYPDEDAPYTDFRPEDKIDLIGSASAIDGRMITSNFKLGGMYKLMVEMQRWACEKMGVKWRTLHEINDNY